MPETEEVTDIKDIFCFKSLYARFVVAFLRLLLLLFLPG